MPSRAYDELRTRLADVDQLMDAHKIVGGDKRGRRWEVTGLNRAAVLMLSAHFEGYLEDAMTEALDALNPRLNAKPLVRGFANPKPDRIDELFAFLGMDKPSKSISWQHAAPATVRHNLESLVDTRNKIAHGTKDVDVDKTDVTRLRNYVEGFTQRFDRSVHDQVEALTGTSPWPR